MILIRCWADCLRPVRADKIGRIYSAVCAIQAVDVRCLLPPFSSLVSLFCFLFGALEIAVVFHFPSLLLCVCEFFIVIGRLSTKLFGDIQGVTRMGAKVRNVRSAQRPEILVKRVKDEGRNTLCNTGHGHKKREGPGHNGCCRVAMRRNCSNSMTPQTALSLWSAEP